MNFLYSVDFPERAANASLKVSFYDKTLEHLKDLQSENKSVVASVQSITHAQEEALADRWRCVFLEPPCHKAMRFASCAPCVGLTATSGFEFDPSLSNDRCVFLLSCFTVRAQHGFNTMSEERLELESRRRGSRESDDAPERVASYLNSDDVCARSPLSTRSKCTQHFHEVARSADFQQVSVGFLSAVSTSQPSKCGT